MRAMIWMILAASFSKGFASPQKLSQQELAEIYGDFESNAFDNEHRSSAASPVYYTTGSGGSSNDFDNNNNGEGFGVREGSPLPPPGQYGSTVFTRIDFDGSNYNEWDPSKNGTKLIIFDGEDTLDHGMFLDRGPAPNTGVAMVSFPFTNVNNQTLAIGALTAYEIELDFSIQPDVAVGETFTMSGRVGCRPYNLQLNPYPQELVTNVTDDPRLAGCHFLFYPQYEQGPEYAFVLTNEGIWAQYTRDPYIKRSLNETWKAFISLKRLASRRLPSPSTVAEDQRVYSAYEPLGNDQPLGDHHSLKREPVDLALQYDSVAGIVRWIVNGQILATLNKFGTLPDYAEDGFNVVLETSGVASEVAPENRTKFFCFMDITKHVNWADPNVFHPLNSTLRPLVQFTSNNDLFYLPQRVQFWDPLASPKNITYGQGLEYDLYYAEMAKFRGAADPRTGLPPVGSGTNENQQTNSQYGSVIGSIDPEAFGGVNSNGLYRDIQSTAA